MIPKLAWRSIWRNKRRTIITTISIALGLALAIFFLSLAEGGYTQMVRDGVRLQAGHITIEHIEYRDAPAIELYVKNPGEFRESIEAIPGVERTKPIIMGQGVALSGAGGVGVAIIGIEPAAELETSPIARRLVKGEYITEDDEDYVVIGSGLARRLKVELGKKIVLQTSDTEGAIAQERYFVKGIYETGVDEIDGYLVQMPVNTARELFLMPEGSVTQFGVILEDQDRMKKVLPQIKEMVNDPDVAVLTWRETMPELVAFIALDKGSNIIFQTILISLILFTIFNTILMSVIERRREFAILLAIGTPPRQLMMQVLAESAFLGLIGVGFGMLIGGLYSYYCQVHGLDMTSFLEEGITVSGLVMDTNIYARVTTPILLGTACLVFFATLLLSFIPMRRAANTPFVDIMR